MSFWHWFKQPAEPRVLYFALILVFTVAGLYLVSTLGKGAGTVPLLFAGALCAAFAVVLSKFAMGLIRPRA